MGLADQFGFNMMKYVHIMPRMRGEHSDGMGAHCWCEPVIHRIGGVEDVRVIAHQGVNVLRLEAEKRRIIAHLGEII